ESGRRETYRGFESRPLCQIERQRKLELDLLQVTIDVDHQPPQLEEQVLEVRTVEHVVRKHGEPAQQRAAIAEHTDVGEGMPLLTVVEGQQRVAYAVEALPHLPAPESDIRPRTGSSDRGIQGPKSIRIVRKHTCHK